MHRRIDFSFGKNRFVSNTFLSYMLLFALAVALIGTISGVLIFRSLRTEVKSGYQGAIIDVGHDMDQQLEDLNKLAVQLSQYTWLKSYIYGNPALVNYASVDVLEVNSQVNELTILSTLYEIIDAIVLVFPDKDMVLSSYGRERMEVFFGTSLQMEGMTYGLWQEALATYAFGEIENPRECVLFGQRKNLLIVHRTLPLNSRSFYANMLFLIDTQKMQKMLAKPTLLAQGHVLVLSAEGEPICNPLGEEALQKINEQLESLGNAESFDVENVRIDENYHLFGYQSPLYGWYYIALVSQQQSAAVVYEMVWMAAGIVLTVFLVGAVLAFAFAKRSFKPISKLNDLFMAQKADTNHWRSYSDIESDMVGLLEAEKQYKPLVRQALLAGLLRGEVTVANVDESVMRKVGIQFRHPFTTVIVVRSQEGKGVQEVAEHIAATEGIDADIWICRMNETDVSMLLCAAQNAEATGFLETVLSPWQNRFDGIGISNTENTNHADFAALYGQALIALGASGNERSGNIVFTSRLKLASRQAIPQYDETELLRLLRNHNYNGIQKMVRKVLAENALHSDFSINQFRYFCYIIAMAGIRVLNEWHIAHPTEHTPEALLKLTKYEQLQDHLLAFFAEICALGAAAKAESQDMLLMRIYEQIDSQLTDQGLCLNSVASALELSPSYTSRYFKAHAGCNLSEYISIRRIALAKKWLAQGKTVSEAARFSGFDSDLTFRRTFKRLTDMNPSDFKEV